MSLTLVSIAVLPNQADLYPNRMMRASFAIEGRNGSAVSQLISSFTPSMVVVFVQVRSGCAPRPWIATILVDLSNDYREKQFA